MFMFLGKLEFFLTSDDLDICEYTMIIKYSWWQHKLKIQLLLFNRNILSFKETWSMKFKGIYLVLNLHVETLVINVYDILYPLCMILHLLLACRINNIIDIPIINVEIIYK